MAGRLTDYLEASASQYSERQAVVGPDGSGITYHKLNSRADTLARFLVSRGVRAGDRVGVVFPKSIDAIVALFGIMKAGAAYVPVDGLGPAERGRRILTDCRVSAVILDSTQLDFVPRAEDSGQPSPTVIVRGAPPSARGAGSEMVSLERALEESADVEVPRPGTDDLAYILHTSGSTGVPKGVMITHRNVVSFIEWCSAEFKPAETDRFSCYPPLHFDAAVLDIYLAAKHGAALYLISEQLAKNSMELARFIAANRLTIWNSPVSALMLLVQFGDLEAQGASGLRLVLFGGEVFPTKYLRQLQRHWPSADYINLYGPTEATTACTFARIPAPIPEGRDAPYPIGFPGSHCRTIALDPTGREVGSGEEGFLHVSGPQVFSGYWNRPEETAAAFVVRDGVRWYNTGDVVKWDPADGFTYVGRRDDMVKRRGYRIELGEIQRALYLHPSVQEAAIVSVQSPDVGVKIVAFLRCHAGKRPTIVDLKTFCATQLPAYMSPDRFVFLNQFPRTSTDKTDYQALKAQLANYVHA